MANKRNPWFYLFLVIFVLAAGYLLLHGYGQQKNGDIYQELSQEKEAQETPSVTPTKLPEAEKPDTGQPSRPPVEIPVDFAELQKRNEDIYAWITIPDTEVDYPVVQTQDNTYYLNHTIEGKEGLPGSIYTEALNTKDFSDVHTVIYGHNMKDGTMFGNLKRYMDRTYMEAHPLIIVYTPEKKLTYQIFAAITYDDRHLLYSFDLEKEEDFLSYLDSLAQVRNMSSYLDEQIEVRPGDRLLTLSTCTGNEKERFLVEAVLINEA